MAPAALGVTRGNEKDRNTHPMGGRKGWGRAEDRGQYRWTRREGEKLKQEARGVTTHASSRGVRQRADRCSLMKCCGA